MHSLPQRNFCPKQKCSRIYNKTKLPQRERECMKELQNETGFSCKSCTQASPHTAWIKSVWTCSFCLFPERPTDNILKTRLSQSLNKHTHSDHTPHLHLRRSSYVVNLEDHADKLRGQEDLLLLGHQCFYHVLFTHVWNNHGITSQRCCRQSAAIKSLSRFAQNVAWSWN